MKRWYVGEDRVNAFCQTCSMAYKEVPDLQIIVVVVPNEKKDRYDAIKKLTCLDYPGKIFQKIFLEISNFFKIFKKNPEIFKKNFTVPTQLKNGSEI